MSQDAGRDNIAAQKAISIIPPKRTCFGDSELTATPELDKVYMGSVQRITDFGAFIEVMPGVDGLLHVSEMANYRVANVRDELKEGISVGGLQRQAGAGRPPHHRGALRGSTSLARWGIHPTEAAPGSQAHPRRLSRKVLLAEGEGKSPKYPGGGDDRRGGDRDRGPRRRR